MITGSPSLKKEKASHPGSVTVIFQIYFFSALAAFFVILGMKETFSSK